MLRETHSGRERGTFFLYRQRVEEHEAEFAMDGDGDGVGVISGGSMFSDGIWSLPEHVLHEIMSCLLVKDAARMATTCKKLNQVFNTVPYLNLGINFFPLLPDDDDDDDEDEDVEDNAEEDHEQGANSENSETESLANSEDSETESLVSAPDGDEDLAGIIRRRTSLIGFVDQTLAKRRMEGLSIHKFKLRTKLDAELRQRFDWWICYLVHCNIKKLVLKFSEELEVDWYHLPDILLTATSLRSLTLSGCRFPCGPVTLRRLRKLRLLQVYLDEKILLDIINTCPDLEDLSVFQCCGWYNKERIHLPGPSQLRFLELAITETPDFDFVEEVVVEAQYLEKFVYSGPTCPNIITNFEENLKILILGGVRCITNKWFCELMSRLPRLQELALVSLDLVDNIEISSSSLKRLIIIYFSGEFLIDTPNLVYFKYDGSLSCGFRNTSLAVKEVVLNVTELSHPLNELLCNKLTPFLHKFASSEHVTLAPAVFEPLFFPVEARVDLLAPLTHIKHLTLEGYLRASPLDALEQLLENLLWIAPNLDSLSIISKSRKCPFELFVKFCCEYSGSGSRCCDLGWECLRKYSSPHLEFQVKCEDARICSFLTDSFRPKKMTCEMASE